MDRITQTDIFESFSSQSPRNNKGHASRDTSRNTPHGTSQDTPESAAPSQQMSYEDIELAYREEHPLLKYYDIIDPEDYNVKLDIGSVIRYSDRIDKISSILQIIDIQYLGDTITTLRVAKQKYDGTVYANQMWNIHPAHYYLFLYRAKNKAQMRIEHPSRKQNEYETDRQRRPIPKTPEQKVMERITQNTLDFEALSRHDPSIRDKIVKGDRRSDALNGTRNDAQSHANYRYHDNYSSYADRPSDRATVCPTDRLTDRPTDRPTEVAMKSLLDSDSDDEPIIKPVKVSRKPKTHVHSGYTAHGGHVPTRSQTRSHNRSRELDAILNKRRQNRRGKIQLTEEEINML